MIVSHDDDIVKSYHPTQMTCDLAVTTAAGRRAIKYALPPVLLDHEKASGSSLEALACL